jgi:hypothetical protein
VLGVDETPWANPRPRLPGWIIFALGVSSWNKSPSENSTPCAKLDSCWWLCWRRRVPAKTRRPEGGNGIRCSWGFAAGTLRMAALYFLGMRKAWFRIPPTPTERHETTTSCGLNPTVKGIPTQKAWENNKLWPKSHRQRDSHRKARDNNKSWPSSHHEGMFAKSFKNNWELRPVKCICSC